MSEPGRASQLYSVTYAQTTLGPPVLAAAIDVELERACVRVLRSAAKALQDTRFEIDRAKFCAAILPEALASVLREDGYFEHPDVTLGGYFQLVRFE